MKTRKRAGQTKIIPPYVSSDTIASAATNNIAMLQTPFDAFDVLSITCSSAKPSGSWAHL